MRAAYKPFEDGEIDDIKMEFFDLSWLVENPKCVGFMTGPVDSGWEAKSIKIVQPYRENIDLFFSKINKFAPYCAVKRMHFPRASSPGEKEECLILRYGSDCKPIYL